MARATSVAWTRDQRLIALNLYCKLPYGKLHKGNPIIKEVANKMGRTASSLAMKLCNFASLDPVVQGQGKSGMTGAARDDRAVWDEFQANISVLGPQSEELLHNLLASSDDQEINLLDPEDVQIESSNELPSFEGSTEIARTVVARRGQHFFRQTILSSYGIRCCISGISIPSLLVASHIKPWSRFPKERLDPKNGLCLSSLHDAAFDCGLITLDKQLKVVLSRRLRSFFPQPALEQNFLSYEGKSIRLPERLAEPSLDFVRYHREVIFQT